MKGSVWECFRRIHLLRLPEIHSTLQRALPRFSKIRQIAFSCLLHALCDSVALQNYREEVAKVSAEAKARPKPALDPANVADPAKNALYQNALAEKKQQDLVFPEEEGGGHYALQKYKYRYRYRMGTYWL